MKEEHSEFFSVCKEAAKQIIKRKHTIPFYIYSHFDPDGLTAASILAMTFKRENIPFRIRILKRLEFNQVREIGESLPKNALVIFCDLGSGVIDAFKIWDPSIQIYILDHHSLVSECKLQDNLHLINPHCFSIDGSSKISGSGVTYFVAININPLNKGFAYLAIIGALGDRQDQGENSSLIGLNRIIVEDALNNQLCTDSVTVWFYDKTRDLVSSLKRLNIDEFNEEISIHYFLEDIGISLTGKSGKRAILELGEEEKKKLASELIVRNYVDPIELYKHDYQLLNEQVIQIQDARVFANRLNACGRMNRPDVGIALCMGDRNQALAELKPIVKDYSKQIGEGINWVLSNGNLEDLSALYFIDGRSRIEENIIGPITSILSSMEEYSSKPVLSCAKIDHNRVKISIRKSRSSNNEIKLDEILRRGIQALNLDTEVGGHSAAAGAILIEEELTSFKMQVNSLLSEDLETGD
ncbi:MAG: DHH family phosphoesterase [Candidatus Hodarchaeales archaeon]|jgi:RecJ-like exonuclease